MERLFLMFLDHTQRRSTVGRTPLDEWSARRRPLPENTRHSQQTNIHAPGGIRTQDLSRKAAAGHIYIYMYIYIYDISSLRVNQHLYFVSLKIYNKFSNYFCELKFLGNTKDPSSAWVCDTSGNILPCGVALRRTSRCTEFHRVKNANLRHPSTVMC